MRCAATLLGMSDSRAHASQALGLGMRVGWSGRPSCAGPAPSNFADPFEAIEALEAPSKPFKALLALEASPFKGFKGLLHDLYDRTGTDPPC